ADLVGEPPTSPDVNLLDVAAVVADDVEELLHRRSHLALIHARVEDDHELVLTHWDHSPPVGSRPRTFRGRRSSRRTNCSRLASRPAVPYRGAVAQRSRAEGLLPAEHPAAHQSGGDH